MTCRVRDRARRERASTGSGCMAIPDRSNCRAAEKEYHGSRRWQSSGRKPATIRNRVRRSSDPFPREDPNFVRRKDAYGVALVRPMISPLTARRFLDLSPREHSEKRLQQQVLRIDRRGRWRRQTPKFPVFSLFDKQPVAEKAPPETACSATLRDYALSGGGRPKASERRSIRRSLGQAGQRYSRGRLNRRSAKSRIVRMTSANPKVIPAMP